MRLERGKGEEEGEGEGRVVCWMMCKGLGNMI